MLLPRRISQTAAVLCVLVAVLAGCQGTDSTGPLAPLSAPGLTTDTTAAQNTGLSTPLTNSHDLWGIWDVQIDPVTYEAVLTPLRESMWHANVVHFMQPPFKNWAGNLAIKVNIATSDPRTDISRWM